MQEQLELIGERQEAEFVLVPLGRLPANEDLEGPEPSKALLDAIRTNGWEGTIAVSRLQDGSYVVRKGRKRIKALRKLGKGDDFRVPCTVREWTGVPDHVDTIADHATMRRNVPAEIEAVKELLGSGLNVKRIAALTGLSTVQVQNIVALLNMNPTLLNAFLEGDIAVTVASELAKRSAQEQAIAAEIYEERGLLRMEDVKSIRSHIAQAAAQTAYVQDELIDMPLPWSVYEEAGIVRIKIPGRGDYRASVDKLLELLEAV